jgi:hypothetical protein
LATLAKSQHFVVVVVLIVVVLIIVCLFVCFVVCVFFYPFPADVANKRHLGSAPKSHFFDLTRKTKVIGLSDLMTLFIDLVCLYCKNTQRAFNVFKDTLN